MLFFLLFKIELPFILFRIKFSGGSLYIFIIKSLSVNMTIRLFCHKKFTCKFESLKNWFS